VAVTLNATPDDRELTLAPLDGKVDHLRGSPAGHLIIEYGDYECPYWRQAFHAIERVDPRMAAGTKPVLAGKPAVPVTVRGGNPPVAPGGRRTGPPPWPRARRPGRDCPPKAA
jgi:hypothetical protein